MDPGTALLVASLMILANGAVLGLMRRHLPGALRRSTTIWLAGSVFIAGGCILFLFTFRLPDILTLTLANGLILLGLAAYWHSLREYYDYPSKVLLLLLPVIAATAGVFWFLAFDPNIKIRVMIVSAAWLTLIGGSAITLKSQASRDNSLSQQVLMGIFGGVLLFTALRALYYSQLAFGANFSIVDNSNWMNLATTILMVVLPIIGTTAFVLMCVERMRRQSQQAEQQHTSETLSYIGHDLRAPLATIVGYTRMLSETGTPEQTQHLRAIERSANYQLTLIDEIMEYAKHELKPLNIQPEPVAMPALLDDIFQQANVLSQPQNNQFEIKAETPLPTLIAADPRRLQQVLLNLISNAAKFTHSGLIRLTVSASVNHEKRTLDFSLSDSGIGIDPKAQATIFNEFEQVEARPGSAGLGLYIAQSIVRNMGGELQLRSTLGSGSCFSFSIPAEPLSSATFMPHSVKQAKAHIAPVASTYTATPLPPAQIRHDLARLARNGQLSEIEDWLQRQVQSHPSCAQFLNEVHEALQALDFQRIELMALAGD